MASDFVQTDAGVSVLPLQLKDKTIVMVMSHPQGTKEMYEQAAGRSRPCRRTLAAG
jgi:hypothetical protein